MPKLASKKNSGESYIVFECTGDLALNLMGTAVVQSVKKQYPTRKIVVTTLFPEVWLHHSDVYRIYKFGAMSYFYDNYIKDKDTIVMRHNPYLSEEYAYGKKHLIDIWCELCGVIPTGAKPKLFFTWREQEAARKLTQSDMPLFFMETHGLPPTPNVPALWARDMQLSLASKVADVMRKEGYRPIQISRNEGASMVGIETLNFDNRQLLCGIQYSSARLFINSFALQAATAFKLSSAAFFVSMEPKVFSYPMHEHVLPDVSKGTGAEAEFVSHPFKDSYELHPDTYNSPYDFEHLYSVDEIVEKILLNAKKK